MDLAESTIKTDWYSANEKEKESELNKAAV